MRVARSNILESGFDDRETSPNRKTPSREEMCTAPGVSNSCKCNGNKLKKEINNLRRRIELLERLNKSSGRTPKKNKDSDDLVVTLDKKVDELKLE